MESAYYVLTLKKFNEILFNSNNLGYIILIIGKNMKSSKNLMTQVGLKKIKEELRNLTEDVRKKINDDIQKAKEFGDLSENAAYTSAMEARDLNETRIAELEDMIMNSKIVISDKGNKDGIVSVGDTVVMKPENGEEITLTVVGVGESDLSKNKVAADTPIAEAILGKKVKAKVVVDLPSGKTNYEIIKIK